MMKVEKTTAIFSWAGPPSPPWMVMFAHLAHRIHLPKWQAFRDAFKDIGRSYEWVPVLASVSFPDDYSIRLAWKVSPLCSLVAQYLKAVDEVVMDKAKSMGEGRFLEYDVGALLIAP